MAMSPSERKARQREKDREKGLVPFSHPVHKDDVAKVKKFIKALQDARENHDEK